MKYFSLHATVSAVCMGAVILWSSTTLAAPNARYGILLNAGYSEFSPDSNLDATEENDYGYRIGVFYDPDGESDRGFEFDVSFVNFGKYEYCIKSPSADDQRDFAHSPATTSRIGRICSEFEADGFTLGATYAIPLVRLSNKRSILDKFSLFFSGGYFDLDFNASHASSAFASSDDGFYFEAGLLWTGGFGSRKGGENFGVRASYRQHDNNGIEYLSVGLVWDL